MLKILWYIIFALICYGDLYAQKQGNIWYFGNNAGVDFNSGKPVGLTNSAMRTNEGCASISDTSGNLLFYSDGVSIWNRKHIKMPNGSGLKGNFSSTQSCVIVPEPGSNNRYYIFTVDAEAGFNGFQYSIINLSSDNGYGDIIVKNQLLFAPSSEKLTAVKHANGKDFWIIAHKWNSDTFCSYLLTSGGLNLTPVKSATGIINSGGGSYTIGCLTVSPDGSKIASALEVNKLVQLFNFNISTGEIKYFSSIEYTKYEPYGVSFSPDNLKLYVSVNVNNSGIYQYDVSSQDSLTILKSAYLINSKFVGALQIGPDQKIYAALVGFTYLGVINNPNVSGPNCNFLDSGVYLLGRSSVLGLPDIVQSYFTVPDISVKIGCKGTNSVFEALKSLNVDSVVWDFGDNSSLYNYSTLFKANHIFHASGTYKIELTSFIKGISYKNYKVISIQDPPWMDTANKIISICKGGSKTIDFSQSGCTYLWSDGSQSSKYTFKNVGKYWLKVSNTYCFLTDSFLVTYLPTLPSIFKDTSVCVGDTLKLVDSRPGYTHVWQDGTQTAKFEIFKPGSYSVIISNGTCEVKDNFNVDFVQKPDAYLNLRDTFICPGKFLKINITDDVHGYLTYLWQDGTKSALYTINAPGKYWVKINSKACSVTDSFKVGQGKGLNPISWKDTFLCGANPLKLNVSQPGIKYTWQDGSDSPVYIISKSGLYSLTRSNQCNSDKNTIKVKYVTSPSLPIWHDTVLCNREYINLCVNTFNGVCLWQDGSQDSCFKITKTGNYFVSLQNACGQVFDTIKVTFDACTFNVNIPNAFSPGNDFLNDTFKPVLSYQPTAYLFVIYNRWGEKLFESTDYKTGWDGKFRNEPAPEDGYIYTLMTFNWNDDRNYYKSGIFYLLRK